MLHTAYCQQGGEDSVYTQECALLEKEHQVETLIFKNNEGIKGAMQFLVSIWNIRTAGIIKKKIKEFQPDVIHIHNGHFAIGPLAIRIAKSEHIPVVVTLHNFRLICPSATLLVSGKLFTDSLTSSFPWKAVIKKAYRDSASQTLWLASIMWFHKMAGTWNMVDRYIVLTDFARNIFITSGLGVGAQYFSVKPNFVEDSAQQNYIPAKHFLFVGRLSEEKGIGVLLDAIKQTAFKLRIAGTGPLQALVEKAAAEYPNITYLGSLRRDQILAEMNSCTALIFPSIWYEGMPMTIIEALSQGTPVIASNLGAMSSMIGDRYNGLHFKVGEAEDLIGKINYWMQLSEDQQSFYRMQARESFLSNYTAENNLQQLSAIYEDVCLHP